ncbi:hypothetical protein [Devosia sp. SL43]|uniref:hypothetical protein n=1 Tax=Devosia sp. SL43 TaxID=2806348 RepID=UPI001F16FABA|nr:hypothetical protein [Devosia sp. SL43]UJW87282.1 hypothetical protein IM737_08615 [Devosia sp. SL43]
MSSLCQLSAIALALIVLAAGPQQASAAQPMVRPVEKAVAFVAWEVPRTDPVVFDNGNIHTVYTQPIAAPIVRLEGQTRITAITTYHWNNGKGADPGSIALVDAHGRLYGPWASHGSPGQGGVQNAYWTVRPHLTLPAGSYIVIDSDLASWAHNEATGGAGMVHIEGRER